jgi:hypothetical protein
LIVLPLSFGSFGESCLLVSWCVGDRCGIVCSDVDHGRSRRPSLEDRGWSVRSGTRWPDNREVGWHCVRSAPYTWKRGARVSWLSLKTKGDGLSVVWPQNHWDCFSRFDLKTDGDGFLGLPSKSRVTVSQFGPQNWQLRFGHLGVKITTTVS